MVLSQVVFVAFGHPGVDIASSLKVGAASSPVTILAIPATGIFHHVGVLLREREAKHIHI